MSSLFETSINYDGGNYEPIVRNLGLSSINFDDFEVAQKNANCWQSTCQETGHEFQASCMFLSTLGSKFMFDTSFNTNADLDKDSNNNYNTTVIDDDHTLNDNTTTHNTTVDTVTGEICVIFCTSIASITLTGGTVTGDNDVNTTTVSIGISNTYIIDSVSTISKYKRRFETSQAVVVNDDNDNNNDNNNNNNNHNNNSEDTTTYNNNNNNNNSKDTATK